LHATELVTESRKRGRVRSRVDLDEAQAFVNKAQSVFANNGASERLYVDNGQW